MKIGVNIYNLYPGKIGGAEQYVRNILAEMSTDKNIKLFLFVNSSAVSTFKEMENLKICHVEESGDRDTQLQFYIDYYAISIMFSPLFFIAPERCDIPSVVSILDVQHEFFPEYFAKKTLKEIRENTEKTLKSADGIITISNYSKNTIIEKYGVDENAIKVTYLNSDSCFDEEKDSERQAELKQKIGMDYIFYPANTWPHKNHINLLKAYKILKEKYHSELKLVFTGDSKQKKKEIEDFIISNGLENDILYLGYLPQRDIPYIFANATIMAFPSIFEGFGIPLVEAMKAGVAIACSKCGSIPEVVGDAAVYFDAHNPQDIADKLYELESDGGLREYLIDKGKAVSLKYSWKECANDTIDYLKYVYNKNKKECNIEYEEYPLVSVITPSFNQGEFIRETIESVLNQNYPNIEYIVMDGGSTDNTIEILKGYDRRITWCSERDKGQADAVNKGINIAKGRIIGWLNSDDTYLDNNTISTIVEYFKTHSDTDMLYGEGYYIDKESNITNRYLTEKYSRARLAEQCIICQPTVFFTKDIVKRVGMLDVEHQLSMDYELWMRIAESGKIAYIPQYLATSRMYEENKTLSRRDEVFKETCKAVKKHYGYVPISWIDGYTDYLCKGSRGLKFFIINIKLFIQYNISNMIFCRQGLEKILRNRFSFVKQKVFSNRLQRENFYDIYSDGWISKEYRTIVNGLDRYSHLVIEGIHCWPLRQKLRLTILLEKKVVLKKTIEKKGEFTLNIHIKDYGLVNEGELVIKANKTFCPKRINGSEDIRNLSCQIKNIRKQ